MSIEANLARARELDDAYDDETCPGCLQRIRQWWLYPAHLLPTAISTPRPFIGTDDTGPAPRCPWNNDALNARRFRRQYIAQHSEAAA